MRYFRVPLEGACVPLVARVPQIENHCIRRIGLNVTRTLPIVQTWLQVTTSCLER